ncbi:MAG: hypothetical protein ACPGYV_15555, partial [Phycisphaeraceae bacterium]
EERPAVLFAPHVETSTDMILSDDYIRKASAVMHEVGGLFVLGLHLTEPDETERTLERWRARRDDLDVICTIRSSPPDRATRTEQLRSRVVVRDLNRPGAEPRRYESNWTFRTYDEHQLRALLRKAPRLNHVATYTFHHDTDRPTSIDGDDLGVVLVLRRDH